MSNAGSTEAGAGNGTVSSAEAEVLELAVDLIRIDTTNTGAPETTVGEREAADYVQAKLAEVGYNIQRVESGAPTRDNVIVRLVGEDPERPALLVHTHLDVVPADPAEWSVHPFAGTVQDGYLWGRGAVDMKDMVAMTLAVARRFKREGVAPPRDVVFAFLADEEAGGALGAQWLVENRPELFEGCSEAIGEVGGFSLTLAEDVRLYPIETGEKGMAWMRLQARGRPGHGSFLNTDNAVTAIADAVARLGNHQFPLVVTDTVRAFLETLTELTGVEFPLDDLEGSLSKLGTISRMIGATVRDTANPTMLRAGYKANVIPSSAEAVVDCRVLPGRLAAFEREVDEILGPDITRDWVAPIAKDALETKLEGDLADAITAALVAEDPGARAAPYLTSVGTDAKAFTKLGIRCFGFAPLRLPPELDFVSLFHGIDERVPVDGLRFGTRVLDRFLRTC